MEEPLFADWVARRPLAFTKILGFWRTVIIEAGVLKAVEDITVWTLYRKQKVRREFEQDVKSRG